MTKMTEEMWIDAGFDALKNLGFAGLKADIIAKRAGVTRGSFYGYYASLAAYHDAILQSWLKQSQQIAEALSEEISPSDQLRALVQAAYNGDLALERAMRGWAQADPKVAAKLKLVDAYRVDVLASLFVALGASNENAKVRAKLLYTNAIGFAFLDKGTWPFSEADLDGLVALYTADL